MATNRFDKGAATWDQEASRVNLARQVAQAIAARVELSKDMSALDFGCGTGLVSLELASRLGSITGADTSQAMLAVLKGKAEAAGVAVRLLPLGTDAEADLGGPYDLIVSSMTLHHVADVPHLMGRLMRHLAPGGRVALADLDAEDGSFHGGDAHDVHHLGFDRVSFRGWMEAAGFLGVSIEGAATVARGGRDHTVFLALGLKA